MRIMTATDIVDELERITERFEENKTRSKNKSVSILQDIYSELNKALGVFEEYISDDLTESAEDLVEKFRAYIENVSRQVGKLEEALKSNPPKVQNHVEEFNQEIEKMRKLYEHFCGEYEAEKSKTKELKALYGLMKEAIFNVDHRIGIYNETAKVKLDTIQ